MDEQPQLREPVPAGSATAPAWLAASVPAGRAGRRVTRRQAKLSQRPAAKTERGWRLVARGGARN